MSGIASFVHFDDAAFDPRLIHRMADAIAHRGPDGIGFLTGRSGAMGQCLLRVGPPVPGDEHPFADEAAGLVVVLDGRIDNRAEIRRALASRTAGQNARSDAELILRCYQAWGAECPKHLVGEFVFLVWDRKARKVFGARDAIGTRHFYYARGDGWLAVASEIKALLATGRVSGALNDSRVLDFLVPEFDRDDETGTFYRDIFRVPAGHAFEMGRSGFRTWRYWNPAEMPPLQGQSMAEHAAMFREQLGAAVACRLQDSGPVGAMLSGGLDSSAVVGLVRQELRSGSNSPLRTYSLVRADQENCREWPHVQAMVKDGGLVSTIIPTDTPERHMPASLSDIGRLDEPFALTHGLTYALVYEAAAHDGCRVVLDGMAGDLLFFSPENTLDWAVRRGSLADLLSVRRAWAYHDLPQFWRSAARCGVSVAAPSGVRTRWREFRQRRYAAAPEMALLKREVLAPWLEEKMESREMRRSQQRLVDGRTGIEHRFASGLLSFAHENYGQIAFASGVEPRSPFSDRRVVELAIRMPEFAKVAVPRYKELLRVAMRDVLPDSVRRRPDIGGHPGWLAYEKLYCRAFSDMRRQSGFQEIAARVADWVDPARFKQQWDAYEGSGDFLAGQRVFAIGTLARWLQR